MYRLCICYYSGHVKNILGLAIYWQYFCGYEYSGDASIVSESSIRRFRNDLGSLIEAYQEVARRLGLLHEQPNIRPINFSKPTAVKIKKNK